MTTKQALYTGALQALGERKFLTTENVKAINTLDNVYDQVLAECLSNGLWNFAIDYAKITGDTGIKPASFGYTMGFAKPAGWVRTESISSDEYFGSPLLYYYDDQQIWAADVTPLYVRYVSSDTGAGLELARWPSLFTRYVELALAERVCMTLTQDKGLYEWLGKELRKAKMNALSKDAMDERQPKFRPPGSWTSARGGRASRGDRGLRSTLTGS